MKISLNNAVTPILIINVVVFILQIVLGTWFTESFMLISSDIFSRPWILLTSMFLHGGITHLFFNMYVLFMFGSLLENRIGTKRFLLIYLLSGIIASFVSSFFYERALGASGAIYGVLGMIVILIPEIRVMPLFIPIPMQLWRALLLFVALDFLFFSNVAVIAHIAGGICGLLYALTLKKQRKRFDHHFSSKHHMDEDDIEEYIRTGRI